MKHLLRPSPHPHKQTKGKSRESPRGTGTIPRGEGCNLNFFSSSRVTEICIRSRKHFSMAAALLRPLMASLMTCSVVSAGGLAFSGPALLTQSSLRPVLSQRATTHARSLGRLMMGGGFGFGKKQDDFAFTGTQRLSAWPKKLKTVPATIQKPDYAEKVPPFSPQSLCRGWPPPPAKSDAHVFCMSRRVEIQRECQASRCRGISTSTARKRLLESAKVHQFFKCVFLWGLLHSTPQKKHLFV